MAGPLPARLAPESPVTLHIFDPARRYLETFKAYEKKSASCIQERVVSEFIPQLTDVLTTIRSINKSDVLILANTFGTLASIMAASQEQLARCPGLGEKKVKRLYEAFHQPLR